MDWSGWKWYKSYSCCNFHRHQISTWPETYGWFFLLTCDTVLTTMIIWGNIVPFSLQFQVHYMAKSLRTPDHHTCVCFINISSRFSPPFRLEYPSPFREGFPPGFWSVDMGICTHSHMSMAGFWCQGEEAWGAVTIPVHPQGVHCGCDI